MSGGRRGPIRRSAGIAGAAGLAVAAGWHLYWLAGGRAGRAKVIPTTAGRPAFQPGPVATATVAAALLATAGLYLAAGLGRGPRWLCRTGTFGAATVLGARAIGDGRQLGFTRSERDTAFAHLDSTVLAPVCAALAVAGFVAA